MNSDGIIVRYIIFDILVNQEKNLIPAHISGADHRLLVETLKTVTDSETGKPVKLGKYLDRLVIKQVQEIRKGKRIKI